LSLELVFIGSAYVFSANFADACVLKDYHTDSMLSFFLLVLGEIILENPHTSPMNTNY